MAMFLLASRVMKDVGFTPRPATHPLQEARAILSASITQGLGNRPVRFVMLAAPFTMGVSIYVFYALQPFLLDLYGDPNAYSIAGLAAAIMAGSQIAGGFTASRIRGLFRKRTTALILGTVASCVVLALLGLVDSFWLALLLLAMSGLLFAAMLPIRQAYLNDMIPSQQRATVLSFDSLMGSSGGVVIQPALGRAADVWSYGTSYAIGAAFQALAVPFLLLSRREHSPADTVVAPPDSTEVPHAA
jgi:MFS family permease